MARMRELALPSRDVPSRPNGFVTISRQAGALGHSLAHRLVERFGEEDDEVFSCWQVFDQRLCEIVAEDPKMAKALDSLLAEEYHTPASDFFRQAIAPTVDQDVLIARVFEVVRTIAATGRAIIVGRAGSEVTRDLPHGVRIRLVAAHDVRVDRLMELNGVDRREAAREAKRIDQHRARLLQARFGIDIDDPLSYDVVWNTGSATVDEIADATVMLVRARLGTLRPE